MQKPFVDHLVDLHPSIIKLIFGNIPDVFLHTYIDNPLIGSYAIDMLFNKVTIGTSDSLDINDLAMHFPVGNESLLMTEFSEAVFIAPHEIKFQNVYQFLSFIDNHPNSKPKIIDFHNLNDVLAVHVAYPEILKSAEIHVDDVKGSHAEKAILNLPYKFTKLGYVGKIDYTLPSTLRDIEILRTELLEHPGYYEDLQTLTIRKPLKLEELLYIPPKLQSLSMDLVWTGGPCKNKFPTSLQSLELELEFSGRFTEWDLSYLTNLKSFTSLRKTIPLSKLHLPKSIINLCISTDDSRNDTFSQFFNLKSLYVCTFYEDILKGIPFPNSLRLLHIDIMTSALRMFPEEVSLGKNFKVPPRLIYLKIDGQYVRFEHDEIRFPPSLYFVDLVGSSNSWGIWSRSNLPTNVLKFTISQSLIHGAVLPESLTTLTLKGGHLNYLEKFDFKNLSNLVSFSIYHAIFGDLDHSFGDHLRHISLEGSYFSKIRIVAPRLKILVLSRCTIDNYGSSFIVPNSITQLEMRGNSFTSLLGEDDSMFCSDRDFPCMNAKNMTLPKSVKSFNGDYGFVTSEILRTWNLQSGYTALTNMTLSRNKLTKIESHLPYTLKTLDLSGNPIIISNSAFFKCFSNLEKLGLACVGLDKYLSQRKKLEFPDSMVELDLRGNNLDNESFKYVKLSNCRRLRFIALFQNPRCNTAMIIRELQENCPLLSRLNSTT
ncbi:uncharacterized protein J8A68_000705 [[Candida] subhashii]|uniref:Uncharacterized protein n=1 Tax=[Candida] subhashii TaxID=561895 RepID=A0A8J5QU80_9ASCO|nr:uncharacterized protein J8A68_000705 [[Candida] subhashii]KAG7665685.1 hypothetical protein J8A68_000705 [[Candida] subhashii]